jgi:hypothetical protein
MSASISVLPGLNAVTYTIATVSKSGHGSTCEEKKARGEATEYRMEEAYRVVIQVVFSSLRAYRSGVAHGRGYGRSQAQSCESRKAVR